MEIKLNTINSGVLSFNFNNIQDQYEFTLNLMVLFYKFTNYFS